MKSSCFRVAIAATLAAVGAHGASFAAEELPSTVQRYRLRAHAAGYESPEPAIQTICDNEKTLGLSVSAASEASPSDVRFPREPLELFDLFTLNIADIAGNVAANAWGALIFSIRDYFGGNNYLTSSRDRLVTARYRSAAINHLFIAVRVISEKDTGLQSMRLIFDTSNLYFVGFINFLGVGFHFCDHSPAGMFPDGTEVNKLPVKSNYHSLGIEGSNFGFNDFENALNWIGGYGGGTTVNSRNLLNICTFISEAARFHTVYARVHGVFRTQYERVEFSGTLLNDVRNWSDGSRQLVRLVCHWVQPSELSTAERSRLLTSLALLLNYDPDDSDSHRELLQDDTACQSLTELYQDWDFTLPKQKESSSNFACIDNDNGFFAGRTHNGDENGDTTVTCRLFSVRALGDYFDVEPHDVDEYFRPPIKESDSNFMCPAGMAIVARVHGGDENGNTSYKCAFASANLRIFGIYVSSWSADIKESNSAFVCPAHSAMVGRNHRGDENGMTSYLCGTVVPGSLAGRSQGNQQSTPIKESSGIIAKANNDHYVMTGRKHEGDENGHTTYYWKLISVQDYAYSFQAMVFDEQKMNPIKESNSKFKCPTNMFVTKRMHSGDENGQTTYWCARLKWDYPAAQEMSSQEVDLRGRVVAEYGQTYSVGRQKESQSNLHCNSGFMIGRDHDGDENGSSTLHCASVLFRTQQPAPTPYPTKQPIAAPSPSCMSGRTRVGVQSETPNRASQFKNVRELSIGDTIHGLDEDMNPAMCSVEAIGYFGRGPVYGNYTEDHFILNPEANDVRPNGDNAEMELVDKFAVLTSCPVGLDESGVGFTALDSDFLGDEALGWSDYVLVHQAIFDIVREVGPFVFSPGTYTSMGTVKKYTRRLYKAMLKCAKNPNKCDALEMTAKNLVDNALTVEAKKKVHSRLGNFGKPYMPGSIAAAVSKGKSVRD